MKARLILTALKLAAVVFVLHSQASVAQAQFGVTPYDQPFGRPTVSPYLNLFRRGNGGGNAILNYYGLVRPQQQAYRQSQQFSQQLRGFEQDLDLRRNDQDDQQRAPSYRMLGTTGHSTSFMTIGGARGGTSSRRSQQSSGASGGYSGHSAAFGGSTFGGQR